MGIGSGLAAQIGFGEETTAGTRIVPTRFFEFTQEGLKYTRDRLESKGLRAGRRVGPTRWAPGKQEVAGPVTFECAPQGFGVLLKHCIGPDVTTGAGPYVHTFAPGDLTAQTFTVQIGTPSIDGTVRPYDYTGMSITDWSLDAQVNAYLMMTLGMYGMNEDVSQTLATAAYPATITPFTYLQGALQIGGSAQDVKKITISANNGLATGRHQIRATTPEQPKMALEQSRRVITGSLAADFTDLTLYNRYRNGTEAALSLTFTSGTASLVISGNIRCDGDTADVTGDVLLEQMIPFKFLSSTSDALAFTAVLTNSDTLP
jgi:hypothetical protein